MVSSEAQVGGGHGPSFSCRLPCPQTLPCSPPLSPRSCKGRTTPSPTPASLQIHSSTHHVKRLFKCQHGGRAHVSPAGHVCSPPLSSSSPALLFQGRQVFNLGLYPLSPSSPHFIHSEPWSSHCLHCKCCWHGGHRVPSGMPTQPQTRPMTFLLVNQKRKKKEKKEKKKQKKEKTTKPNPKPCKKKNHTTPVGHRLLFKETFLPNYLKASSATWWWHPPWPAHPPTVCLWGEGSAPHPALLPPCRWAAQAGGWAGGAAHCLYPPPLSKPSFRASCCVGRGEPAVQSGPRCPPSPGGPSSRCLRPRFSHRMFYQTVHMV